MTSSADVVAELPPGADNSLRRMGERVAALEERVNGVKANTEVMRSTIHEINHNMQLFVVAEQGCQNNLASLTGQVSKMTESIVPMADAVREFQRMHGELLELLNGYERRRGVASFGKKFGLIVGGVTGVLTLISGLFLGIVWMMQHIQVHP